MLSETPQLANSSPRVAQRDYERRDERGDGTDGQVARRAKLNSRNVNRTGYRVFKLGR